MYNSFFSWKMVSTVFLIDGRKLGFKLRIWYPIDGKKKFLTQWIAIIPIGIGLNILDYDSLSIQSLLYIFLSVLWDNWNLFWTCKYVTLILLRHSAFLYYSHVFSGHSPKENESIWNFSRNFCLCIIYF